MPPPNKSQIITEPQAVCKYCFIMFCDQGMKFKWQQTITFIIYICLSTMTPHCSVVHGISLWLTSSCVQVPVMGMSHGSSLKDMIKEDGGQLEMPPTTPPWALLAVIINFLSQLSGCWASDKKRLFSQKHRRLLFVIWSLNHFLRKEAATLYVSNTI